MRISISLVACALSLGTLPAQAQESDQAHLERPGPDQGYYLTLGAHYAQVAARDDGDWVSGPGAAFGTFRLGQSVTEWFDLGLRIDYGRMVVGERSGELFSLGLDATLRPSGPWVVRLGVGMGALGLGAAPNSDDEAGTFGALAALELGYSLFPFYEPGESGAWTFTPLLRLGSVQLGSDNSAYWVGLGIDVTWWMGLPRNQLQLSLEEAFSEEKPSP